MFSLLRGARIERERERERERETAAFFSQHRWHVSWADNEDLVDTACGSCHIPFYCQPNRGIKETLIVDGAYGFAGTDLPHGDATLYIGIDPHAEITRTFTYHEMMFPMVDSEYEACAQTGYDAFMAWDGTHIAKVAARRPNYEALYVLWCLKGFEFLFHQCEACVAGVLRVVWWLCAVWSVGAHKREKVVCSTAVPAAAAAERQRSSLSLPAREEDDVLED